MLMTMTNIDENGWPDSDIAMSPRVIDTSKIIDVFPLYYWGFSAPAPLRVIAQHANTQHILISHRRQMIQFGILVKSPYNWLTNCASFNHTIYNH